MNKILLLAQGYVQRLSSGILKASSSTVLIQTGASRILVDPGANIEILKTALQQNNLKPSDIDLIFLTHYHPDHILGLRLFPQPEIVDVNTRYSKDEEIPYSKFIPGTDIEVVPTPGHCPEHASLIVNSDDGKCGIAGDLFWWENNQKQIINRDSLFELIDPYAVDFAKLKESRQKLIELVDFIIPGHGNTFRVEK